LGLLATHFTKYYKTSFYQECSPDL